MEHKQRCQSCGMPLGPGFYGTYITGAENQQYCKFCYKNGGFTDPRMTKEDMIERSVKHMMDQLHMPEEAARTLANTTIPMLSRWKYG